MPQANIVQVIVKICCVADKNRADYSKLVMADIGDIQKMIADEEAALRDQLSEEGLDVSHY